LLAKSIPSANNTPQLPSLTNNISAQQISIRENMSLLGKANQKLNDSVNSGYPSNPKGQ
tara:strand:- start:1113 stop:1289 length:177 start_codon:yes stop_codon:yes gene_type:complete